MTNDENETEIAMRKRKKRKEKLQFYVQFLTKSISTINRNTQKCQINRSNQSK